jgi:BolA protein
MTDDYANLNVALSSLDLRSRRLRDAVDRDMSHDYPGKMQTKQRISEKLTAAFSPQSLEVVDESHKHEGHAGHKPGGETHFRVYIVSDAFKGKSRVARHRMINETLSSELSGGVHALAIHAKAPGEGMA